MKIERSCGVMPVKITTDLDTSKIIPFNAGAGATLYVVSGDGTITWYGKVDPDGDSFPLYDSSGNAVTTNVTEGNAFELPSALFACPYVVGEGADVTGFISVSG
jgi:hypothetical protein